MSSDTLPFELRISCCRLARNLHVDVEPQKEEKKVTLSRRWWKEPCQTTKDYDKYNALKKHNQFQLFALTLSFIEKYLLAVSERSHFRNILQNKLSVEVCVVCLYSTEA